MPIKSRSSHVLSQHGIWAIFLVGFMGAGKTTIGLAVAKLLGWRFIDLDDQVEAEAGQSVGEIFRCSGEEVFRRLELNVLRRLCEAVERREPIVVALGGGTFVQAAARELIAAAGQPSVFLDAPLSELLVRCRNSTQERPLARDEKRFRELYTERRPAYLAATVRARTTLRSPGKAAKAVVDEVVAAVSTDPVERRK